MAEIEDQIANILNLCEMDPNAALELLKSMESSQIRDKPFFKFAKALAYGSKGLLKAT